MSSPGAIKTALGTRLRSISGLNVYDNWPDQIETPCAIIRQGEGNPEQTFGRGDTPSMWMMEVQLLTTLAPGMSQAQTSLDPFLTTSSTGGVFGAIAADRTLGGVVDTVFVKLIRDYDPVAVGEDVQFMGSLVELECWG